MLPQQSQVALTDAKPSHLRAALTAANPAHLKYLHIIIFSYPHIDIVQGAVLYYTSRHLICWEFAEAQKPR